MNPTTVQSGSVHFYLSPCFDKDCPFHNYQRVYPRYQLGGLAGDHLLEAQRTELRGLESLSDTLKRIRQTCLELQVAAVVEDDHGTRLGTVNQAGHFRPKRAGEKL